MPSSIPTRGIEDLVDFFNHWPEVRGDAVTLRNDKKLTPDQAEILNWMIFIIDRVGPADLPTQKDPFT